MEDEDNVINSIINEGLKPALKRDLSLFTSSCLGEGYTNILSEISGINYNAVGGISISGDYQSLINDEFISKQVDKLIKQNKLNTSLKWADELFVRHLSTFKKAIEEYNKNKDAKAFIKGIIDIYPKYLGCLGLYNAVYRYLNTGGSGLTQSEMELIGKSRNIVASLYPEIENWFKTCSSELVREKSLEEDYLIYLTKDELLQYLNSGIINREVNNRKKGYIHLHIPSKKEIVVTKPSLIDKVKNELFFEHIGYNLNEFKGNSAYPGFVRGFVRKLDKKNKITGGFILVAINTNPKDINIIKEAMAIVTDEGGILSHASIIAREMRIPCIIGTKIATQVLKEGDLVEVDANQGIIRILKKAE